MDFSPVCCWRTKLLTDDEMNDGPPTTVLAHHLPQAALLAIFGRRSGQMTRKLALENSQGRLAVMLTIYLVSTNDEQARRIAWCFQEIPTRIYRMRPDDFFSKKQGRYDTMGVDRLASMKAVGDMIGYPAMVIDGGTCLTYTACDTAGQIMGGGITLGLMAKFSAISQNSKNARGMEAVSEAEQMIYSATDMVDQGKKLETFSRDTKQAVVSTVLKEYAFFLREVIKKYLLDIFLAEVGTVADSSSGDVEGTSHTRRKPEIIFAGGDAELLSKLLNHKHNGLLDPDPEIPPFDTKCCKHLMAFGIAVVLKEKQRKFKETPVSEMDKLLIGCRVAKQFVQPDDEGDYVYRGTISASIRDNQTEQAYLVLYDDVDTEELTLIELHAALTLYANVGEKLVSSLSGTFHKVVSQKKDASSGAANTMEELDMQVKNSASNNRSLMSAVVSKAQSNQLHGANLRENQNLSAVATQKPVPKPSTKRAPVSPSSQTKPKKPKKREPKMFVNRRLGKFFGDNETDLFFGVITSYDEKVKFWHIDYDDGDEEEYDENDVLTGLELYDRHKDLDPKLK